uniref:Uncharacterized protein n=1 Tax=Rhizophora mucronata TaxID=61149 RepID=A0A2P2JIR2_RHIMU
MGLLRQKVSGLLGKCLMS